MTSEPSPRKRESPPGSQDHPPEPLVDPAAEPLIEAFEEAWQRGEPRIADYLGRWTGPAAAVLAELAIIDIEYRLKRGERPGLETYLTAHPGLGDDRHFMAAATRMLDRGLRAQAIARLASAGLAETGADCRFEDFRLEEQLGRGGNAVVYRARRRSPDGIVAIKVLRGDRGNRDERMVRLLREARAVRRLDHRNIVAVQGVGRTSNGEPFIVMDFVEGGSLDDWIADGALPVAEVVRMVADVADAVEHAHGQGVVHRDLKPSNVLLTETGEVRVSDFGLAKLIGGGELTITIGSIGTAGFMAPEQADRRLGAIGPRTDVYGLGGVLYAALTGRPPFVANSIFSVLERVCGGEPPPPPRSIRGDIPAVVEGVCLACLKPRPDDRPASAAVVAAALRECARRMA